MVRGLLQGLVGGNYHTDNMFSNHGIADKEWKHLSDFEILIN